MDAWIEIKNTLMLNVGLTSHPLWMRGLKYFLFSHITNKLKVASFMDAWIEIEAPLIAWLILCVASFMDAWIEMHSRVNPHVFVNRRILYGCVD